MPKVVIAVRVDQDLKDELSDVSDEHLITLSSACEKILKHGCKFIRKAKEGNQVGLNLSFILGHTKTPPNRSTDG